MAGRFRQILNILFTLIMKVIKQILAIKFYKR